MGFRGIRKQQQAGFTLIELAIIIAVLAILGAVGATKFASLTNESKNSGAYAALSNARSALAMALAKDPNGDGKVSASEYWQYLQGATTSITGNTFGLDNYTITFTGDEGSALNSVGITGISTASIH